MHPINCRVACDVESCDCTPARSNAEDNELKMAIADSPPSVRAEIGRLNAEIERLREHAVTLAETARQMERERCISACTSQRGEDPCKGEDEAHERAIDHCVRAIGGG